MKKSNVEITLTMEFVVYWSSKATIQSFSESFDRRICCSGMYDQLGNGAFVGKCLPKI